MMNPVRDQHLIHRMDDLRSKGWDVRHDGVTVKVTPPKEIRDLVGYVEDVTIFSGSTFDAAVAFAEGFSEGFKVCKERVKHA